MALSAEDFREAERKKMRLQASIAARRNSLITMVPRSIPQSAGVVPRPDDLPGRATADANNAAALKYLENAGNQFGPQSLNTLEATGQIMDPFNQLNLYPQVANSPFTKALNARADNLTADDMHRTGMVDPKEHAAAGPSVLNDEAPGYAQVEDLGGLSAPVPQPPSVTAPPPPVVDGINVAPGAKNAGVPGNRSRIAELLGLSDATRQRNFNAQAFDERTHGEGQRFFNQRFGTSPMPSTTTPTAVNYNKPVKLTLQESFVRIQKDADKQLKITKSLEALGLMRKGTADKAKAKYEARLDSLGEQVAVSLLKEGMSRLEVAQALQELPLSGEARDRLVKTYGVDVKKAKKETEFQQFYDAAGNPVARYIKGTPEYFEAVNNTDLRTDKPSATSDISDKVLESFTPESVIAFRSGGSKDTTLLVSAGGPMMEPKTQLDIRKAGRTDIGKLIKRPLEEIRKVITAVDKVKASLKRPSQAEIKAIEEKYGLDSKTDEGSKGIRQIALINSYQRLIDPATVREGDVALQRSAASLWEQTEMAIKRIREGTFLTESMEAEIARLANDFEYQIIRQFSPSLKDGERILKERYSDYKNFSDAGRKAEADLYSVLPKSEHEFIERRLKAQKNLILVRSKEFPIKLNPVDPEGDLAASNYLPGTYYLMPNETTPRVIKR